MSLPGVSFFIPRAYMTTVEFDNINGTRQEMTLSETAAYAVQHEIDHLDGILIVDRSSRDVRRSIKRKMQKFKKSLNTKERKLCEQVI